MKSINQYINESLHGNSDIDYKKYLNNDTFFDIITLNTEIVCRKEYQYHSSKYIYGFINSKAKNKANKKRHYVENILDDIYTYIVYERGLQKRFKVSENELDEMLNIFNNFTNIDDEEFYNKVVEAIITGIKNYLKK